MYEAIDVMISNGQVLTGNRVGIAMVKKDRSWTVTVACGGEVAMTASGGTINEALMKLNSDCLNMVAQS